MQKHDCHGCATSVRVSAQYRRHVHMKHIAFLKPANIQPDWERLDSFSGSRDRYTTHSPRYLKRSLFSGLREWTLGCSSPGDGKTAAKADRIIAELHLLRELRDRGATKRSKLKFWSAMALCTRARSHPSCVSGCCSGRASVC